MRRNLLALRVALLLCGLWPVCAPAADALQVIVGPGVGSLAVSDDGGKTWRSASTGTPLPAACRLRSADDGTSRVQLPEGELVIGPDAALECSLAERRLTLDRGRVHLANSGEQPWTLRAGDGSVEIAASATANVTVDAGRLRSVAAVRGTLRLHRGAAAAREIAEGKRLAAPTAQDSALQPLSADELKQLAAWAAPPPAGQGLGQLVIKDAQSGAPQRLDIARCHINVVLQPPVALVQLDQSFYNPYPQQAEGTFVFNLPPRAAISRFAMFVTHDRLIEGELIQREQAVNIYESIVRQRRDPAILEQIGDNLFRMRVFPVPRSTTKRVLLDFTVPLEGDRGHYEFRLPLLSDLKPIGEFQIGGTIHGPTSGAQSPSHPALAFIANQADRTHFTWQQANYQPQSDLLITFDQPLPTEPRLRTMLASPLPERAAGDGGNPPPASPPNSAESNELRSAVDAAIKNDLPRTDAAVYFLAQLCPVPPTTTVPGPADVLILVDTTSAARDQTAVRQAVRTIVGNLRSADRFRLVCVDVAARPLGAGWAAPGSDAARATLQSLQREFGLGAGDLAVILNQSVAGFEGRPTDRRRLAVYVGSGDWQRGLDPTTVEPQLAALRQTNTGFVVVATPGNRRAQRPPDGLHAFGGLCIDATSPSGPLKGLLRWLLAGLPSPVRIEQIEVAGVSGQDLFVPAACLPGEVINVSGRMAAGRDVVLRLSPAGAAAAPQQWSFAVEPQSDDLFVGRWWAQQKIAHLTHLEEEGTTRCRPRIVELAEEWSLLSRHTAFLVLESEPEYAQWNIDRRQRRRYWRPPGARPAQPRPEWIASIRALADQQRNHDVLSQTLQAARQAINEDRPRLARRFLLELDGQSLALRSPEYRQLLAEAEARVAAQVAGGGSPLFGARQSLFDATGGLPRWDQMPSLAPLLTQTSDSRFAQQHPQLRHLLRAKSFTPHQLSRRELTRLLEEGSATNVVVDTRRLDEVGFGDEASMLIWGFGRLPIVDLVQFALRQENLMLVEEPHRLLVTTEERADARVRNELYQVDDLVLRDRLPAVTSLINADLDRQTAARKRLEAKLRQPISVAFEQEPLGAVFRHFARVLDDTVLVDRREVAQRFEWHDEDIATGNRITARWQNVPAGEALQWILDDCGLDYVLDYGAVVITGDNAESRGWHTPRLHSVRGLVMQVPAQDWSGAMGATSGQGRGGIGGGMTGEAPRVPDAGDSTLGMPRDGLSAGGDGPPPPAASEAPVAADTETYGLTPQDVEAQRLVPDFDLLIDLITKTVGGSKWDSYGGPDSATPLPMTLDLVVCAGARVQQQVEATLERLRRMPPATKAKLIDSDSDLPPTPTPDFDHLIGLLGAVIAPTRWESVGGPCSMAAEPSRAALSVRATANVHAKLHNLLTMMHRSRYELMTGRRPWETAGFGDDRPLLALAGLPELARRAIPVQPAEAARLPPAALVVRAAPSDGSWRWRTFDGEGRPLGWIALRRLGGRMELATAGRAIRCAGEAAAVGYPGLLLVELGPWGESARQLADVCLPWMPHRTAAELAQAWDIRRVEGQGPDALPAVARLRLTPPGAAFDEGRKSCLELAFDAQRRLTGCDSYVDGALAQGLRFDGWLAEAGQWRTVRRTDASGRILMRWELETGSTQAPQLPALAADWPGYLLLDRNDSLHTAAAPLAAALAAIGRNEWNAASEQLKSLPPEQRQHPLVLLLEAACRLRSEPRKNWDAILPVLRQAVSPAPVSAIRQFLVDSDLAALTAAQRMELLEAQPAATRTAADWVRLGRQALQADQRPQALQAAEAAAKLAGAHEPDWSAETLRIEALLQLDRGAEAVAAARGWAARPTVAVDEVQTLASLLVRYGQAKPAAALLEQAAATEGVSAARRFAILRQHADLRQGLARWRLLLAAAEAAAPDAPDFDKTWQTLLGELASERRADFLADLIQAARQPHTRTPLKLELAKELNDRQAAGDLLWELYRDGQLAPRLIGWACEVWRDGRQPQRSIEVLENWLRAGRRLSAAEHELLKNAYRATNRGSDLERAATDDLFRQPDDAPGGF